MMELITTATALLALILFILWLGRKEATSLPPPPPATASYSTHMVYWLEIAAKEDIHPGADPLRLREWASQIPHPKARRDVIDILSR